MCIGRIRGSSSSNSKQKFDAMLSVFMMDLGISAGAIPFKANCAAAV